MENSLIFQYGEGDGGENAGQHTPIEAAGVEAPPMPFEEVGGDIAAIEARYDPLEYGVDVTDEETQDDAGRHNGDACQVIHIYRAPVRGRRIDILQIDVIDEIGLC